MGDWVMKNVNPITTTSRRITRTEPGARVRAKRETAKTPKPKRRMPLRPRLSESSPPTIWARAPTVYFRVESPPAIMRLTPFTSLM